jgi:hypothetical protein
MLSLARPTLFIIVGSSVGVTIILLALAFHCRWLMMQRKMFQEQHGFDSPGGHNQAKHEESSRNVRSSDLVDDLTATLTESLSFRSGSVNIRSGQTSAATIALEKIVASWDMEEGAARIQEQANSTSDEVAVCKLRAIGELQSTQLQVAPGENNSEHTQDGMTLISPTQSLGRNRRGLQSPPLDLRQLEEVQGDIADVMSGLPFMVTVGTDHRLVRHDPSSTTYDLRSVTEEDDQPDDEESDFLHGSGGGRIGIVPMSLAFL